MTQDDYVTLGEGDGEPVDVTFTHSRMVFGWRMHRDGTVEQWRHRFRWFGREGWYRRWSIIEREW